MSFFGDYWDQRKQKTQKEREAGYVIITSYRNRIHVAAPIHSEFIKGAKELAGTWRHTSAIWTFKHAQKKLVYALCCKVYGANAVKVVGGEEF